MITHPALLSGAAFVIKITLVFLLGALFAALLRNRSAAARHFAWALTLGGALALALLVPVAPRLEMPVMTVLMTVETAAAPAPEASALAREAPAAAASEAKTILPASTAAPRAAWAPSPLLLLWLAGVARPAAPLRAGARCPRQRPRARAHQDRQRRHRAAPRAELNCRGRAHDTPRVEMTHSLGQRAAGEKVQAGS